MKYLNGELIRVEGDSHIVWDSYAGREVRIYPRAAEGDDMQLPVGKTCGDCASWLRCKAFIGSLQPTNTRCDWSPSAFQLGAA